MIGREDDFVSETGLQSRPDNLDEILQRCEGEHPHRFGQGGAANDASMTTRRRRRHRDRPAWLQVHSMQAGIAPPAKLDAERFYCNRGMKDRPAARGKNLFCIIRMAFHPVEPGKMLPGCPGVSISANQMPGAPPTAENEPLVLPARSRGARGLIFRREQRLGSEGSQLSGLGRDSRDTFCVWRVVRNVK